jgi:hypothetical protein
MGLVEVFIANVFDIYPSSSFVESFLTDQSLNIAKILEHDFLKLSLVYSYIWQHIYKTYPTKRDFINFVNTLKIIPEACNLQYDKTFVEKCLNTFLHAKMGMIKHLDTLTIFNAIQAYVVDLGTSKFVEDELIKKWKYRFIGDDVETRGNLLMVFCSLYKSYVRPCIYEYQYNPITSNLNETILFNDLDDTYLTEHEKIQYTFYKDNHLMMKWIDQIAIWVDCNIGENILRSMIDSLGTEKNISLLNCQYKFHDPCFSFNVPPALQHMMPAVFSNFVYISDKNYPEVRSLSINKDHGIYYLHAQKPVENTENIDIVKSYDRYIITNLDHSTNKVRINKYIVLDPIPSLEESKIDVLCGPRTWNEWSERMKEAGLTCTMDSSKKTRYVVDLYQELDLLAFMSNGVVPIIGRQSNVFVKPLVTGYQVYNNPIDVITGEDEVVRKNIQKNLRFIKFIKSMDIFQFYWKQHIQLSCPSRTINSRNGLLLYMNFVYMYFAHRLDAIVGLEDKKSRNGQYCVVLVDNRPNPLSILSILFTLSNLNVMWGCKIYTSVKGMPYYTDALGDLCDVVHWPDLDVAKFHIDVYNNTLKSSSFWKSIGSQKTLIIQDDGILLKPGIDRFMKFDYIGASWVDSVANEYIKSNITEDLVGNGGFSLRTNELMIQVCDVFVKEKNWLFYKNITQIPEDVYFIYGLKKLGTAKLPTHKDGTEFASEEVCNMASLGVHKLWSYHISDITQTYFNNILQWKA